MSSPDQFKYVEDEYFRLKGQFAVGRITQEQFDAALQALVIRDAHGRAWMMGVDSGAWYMNDGSAWVQADPYAQSVPRSSAPPTDLPERARARSLAPPPSSLPTYTAPSPPPPYTAQPAPIQTALPAQSSGCGSLILKGCLAVIALVACAAVLGFVGFQSGALTPNSLLNLAGLGPATIQVTNFRDDPIQVSVTSPRTSDESAPARTDLDLNAFDIKSTQTSNPGKYFVEFRAAQGMGALGICNLTVRGGDEFQSVVLPERIVVNRVNNPPSAGRDLIITTSQYCR